MKQHDKRGLVTNVQKFMCPETNLCYFGPENDKGSFSALLDEAIAMNIKETAQEQNQYTKQTLICREWKTFTVN